MNASAIKIAQLITYLLRYFPFEVRLGVQKIFHTFENRPMTNKDSKIIKDAFMELGIEPHRSGELAVPEDLAQYKFLFLHAEFNDNCSAFKPIEPNRTFYAHNPLYEEAVDLYHKRHYKDSDEYYADVRAKKNALAYEVKYLTDHISLPEGAYFEGHGEVDVYLCYKMLDAYIKVHYVYDEYTSFDGLQIIPEMRKYPFNYHYVQRFSYADYWDSLEEGKLRLENDCFKVLDQYNSKSLYREFKEPVLKNVLLKKSPELTQFVEDYFNDRLAS